VEEFKLVLEFPEAGEYFIAFDFMHNLAGLLRFASVTRRVIVGDERLFKPKPPLTGDVDSLLNGRYALRSFDSGDAFSSLQQLTFVSHCCIALFQFFTMQ
jgi:hypothetical protein